MTDSKEAQQPPPRKVKLLHEVRSVRTEQLSKLHAKHHAETELLEDIKEFAKARAALEKSYAQGLHKLSSQFLQKREFPPVPKEAQEDDGDDRTVHQTWHSLLEETSRVAQSRLAASEVVSGQVSDSIKLQKNLRIQTLKKCEELCKAWDEEIHCSVRELARAKKNYSDSEKAAQEARAKSDEANQRLKKGTLKLFQSKTTLGKHCTRLNAKRSICDKRSAHLRNDYLLHLSSANTHQERLFNVDLPYIMQSLDSDLHARIRKYFVTFCTAEIEACTFAKMCSEQVLGCSEKIAREFHHDSFLKANPVFTSVLHYQYDPIPLDEVTNLIVDDTEALYLEREARKWATEVARMSKLAENVTKQMANCQSNTEHLKGSSNSSDSGFSQDKDPDTNYNNLRDYLRKVETTKLKAEAKLEVLRNAGIEVDEWIQSAYEALAKEALAKEALAKEAELEAQMSPPAETTEQQPAEMNQTIDTTFDTAETLNMTGHDTTGPDISQAAHLQCTSLYPYTAQRDDELTIIENEPLEIVEESEGDGWIKVQNGDGDSGYIPESYVAVHRLRGVSVSHPLRSDYDTGVTSEYSQESANSLTDFEVQAVTASMMSAPDSGTPALCYVRALYDFTGSSAEELTFLEGTVFKVTKKGEDGVDDGYWEGELAGRIGVFPSLLVEEVDENGSILGSEEVKPTEHRGDDVPVFAFKISQSPTSPEDMEEVDEPELEPPDFAPPDFAPPPLPQFTLGTPLDGSEDVYGKIQRPASFANFGALNDFVYPEESNSMPRSAPQSPLSPSIKPVRAAPAPPVGASARQSWGQYGEEDGGEESIV